MEERPPIYEEGKALKMSVEIRLRWNTLLDYSFSQTVLHALLTFATCDSL